MTHVGAGLRHPEGAWGWSATGAALAVAVVPQVVRLTIAAESRTASNAVLTAAIVVNVVIVASGVHIYLHHRLTGSDSTAWLAAGTMFACGFWLTVTGLELTGGGDRPSHAIVAVADIAVLSTLLAMVRVSERAVLRVDPALLGLTLAVVTSTAVIVIDRAVPALAVPGPATIVGVPVLGIGLLVALDVHRLATLPIWARDRLAIAIAALTASRACVVGVGTDRTLVCVSAIVLATAAAVLFLSTSLAVLRLAIDDDRLVISTLQDQVATTEAQSRADRERLHEVRGTIAGIASASRLIHREPIPASNRELLEEMLERESARLQRLVQGARRDPAHVLELDEVLRPLVIARRVQGLRISWEPTGHRVWGREDELAEVVNVLLENAAQHAPGTAVALFTRGDEHHVQIVVADSGPGVPEALHLRIFDRGVRGDSSSGDGLGLHLAQHLMIQSGGYLRLDTGWPPGAVFVAGVRSVAQHLQDRCDVAPRVVPQ